MTPEVGVNSGGRVAVWRRLGRALWRLKFLLVLVVIAGAGAAYGLSAHAHKQYKARALIQLSESAQAARDGIALRQLVATTQTLAGTSAVRSQAASTVGGPSALGTIAVSGDPVGGFITVASTQRSPAAAAAAATAYARATIAIVGAQGTASLTQPATPPRSPSSPRKVRNTVLGGLGGLLVALLLVVVAATLDRRLRIVDDVEQGFGLAVLASVPAEAFRGKRSPAIEAAFARLRASLVNLENDRPIRTVMVVSAAVNEGKTLVSTSLAVALARAGKDVILLEADLRRPRIAERLGLEAPAAYAATITDPESIERALTEVSVPEPAYGRLRVLACDAPAAAPAELLESGEMVRALEQMTDLADVVVIDSSPLLAVPDALSLLPLVDAVVVVARLHRSRRDLLRAALGQIHQAKATLIGAVVTGARHGDPYYAGGYLPSKPVATPAGAPGITARRPRTADEPPPPVEFAPPPSGSSPTLEPAPEPELPPAPELEPPPAPEPVYDPDPEAEFLIGLAPAYAATAPAPAPDEDDEDDGESAPAMPPPPPPRAEPSAPLRAWAPPPPPPPGAAPHRGAESALARWRRRRAARRREQ